MAGTTKIISAIDLFCGAGGLTKGLENAGIDVRLGIDIDPACEYPYSNNNRASFLLNSVEKLDGKKLKRIFRAKEIRVLAGCAPCQTFSSYNQKAKNSDDRWWLLLEFSRLVKEVNPDIVTMENVPGLAHQDVFQQFVNSIKALGYYTSFQIVDCSEYGLAQTRKRLVFMASKLGPVKLVSPKDFCRKRKTVADVIGDMQHIEAGEVSKKDPVHQSAALSKTNLKRIKKSIPGGTWRDWPKYLVAKCHTKATGSTYPGVYGRMEWDKPAPTITTQFMGFGNGRFGHPDQDRAISLREGALIQGFPRSYKFTDSSDPIHKTILGRLIGNAVPVPLGRVIGRSIVKHIRHSYA